MFNLLGDLPWSFCSTLGVNDFSQLAARFEVDKHWMAIIINHDVGRCDIIMGISQTVKMFEASANSLDYLCDPFRIKLSFVMMDEHIVAEGAIVAFKTYSREVVVTLANAAVIPGNVIVGERS